MSEPTYPPQYVEVYQPTCCAYGNGPDIYYGQALTGRPIHHARIIDPPQGQRDIDWIDQVLATRIAPGGIMELAYMQNPGTAHRKESPHKASGRGGTS